jgi:hypothetical protein
MKLAVELAVAEFRALGAQQGTAEGLLQIEHSPKGYLSKSLEMLVIVQDASSLALRMYPAPSPSIARRFDSLFLVEVKLWTWVLWLWSRRAGVYVARREFRARESSSG